MSIRNLVTRCCANCANNDLKNTDSDDRADCVTCEQPGKNRCEWEPHQLLSEGYVAGLIDGRNEVFEQIERLK